MPMDTLPDRLPATPVAAGAVYTIFVKDLVLLFQIGVYTHEHGRRQRVRVNAELTVRHPGPGFPDEIAAVVSYEALVTGIRHLAEAGHVKLIETVAERVAALCLADERVLSTRVTVEKLDVFPDAAAVGITVTRHRA